MVSGKENVTWAGGLGGRGGGETSWVWAGGAGQQEACPGAAVELGQHQVVDRPA